MLLSECPDQFFRIIRRNGAQAVDVVRIVGRVDVLVDGKDAHFHACRRIVVDSPLPAARRAVEPDVRGVDVDPRIDVGLILRRSDVA